MQTSLSLMTALIISFVAGILLFGIVIILQQLQKAPVAYEDKDGFHIVKEKEETTPQVSIARNQTPVFSSENSVKNPKANSIPA